MSEDLIIKLRDELRSKGYDAKIANIACFDIDQDGYIHYLSQAEAIELNSFTGAVHPVNLHSYAERLGLNLWYHFRGIL